MIDIFGTLDGTRLAAFVAVIIIGLVAMVIRTGRMLDRVMRRAGHVSGRRRR